MPYVGRVGDPMPYYDQKDGLFKVLYLQEYINNMPFRFHPIWAVATKDCASYESLGELLPYGGNDFEQDAALGTGCAYEKDGTYYPMRKMVHIISIIQVIMATARTVRW